MRLYLRLSKYQSDYDFYFSNRLLTHSIKTIIPRIFEAIEVVFWRDVWRLKCYAAIECNSTVISQQLLCNEGSACEQNLTGARFGCICSYVLCVAFSPTENRKPVSRVTDATPQP